MWHPFAKAQSLSWPQAGPHWQDTTHVLMVGKGGDMVTTTATQETSMSWAQNSSCASDTHRADTVLPLRGGKCCRPSMSMSSVSKESANLRLKVFFQLLLY